MDRAGSFYLPDAGSNPAGRIMSTTIVGELLVEAETLKASIRGARDAGAITDGEAHRCFSSVAGIIQVAKVALVTEHRSSALWDHGPLSEFMRWPNRGMPCPKCDNSKSGKAFYKPEGKEGPERMQHTCSCGYSIYTKPSDASGDDVF